MKPQRLKGIPSLDGPTRYRHFVKSVSDREEAWGLYDDGWALSGVDDGVETFCLWPEKEFAAACADGMWAGYEPEAIPLEDLMEDLLPQLMRDGLGVVVFPTPDGKGVIPETQALLNDLRQEETHYL